MTFKDDVKNRCMMLRSSSSISYSDGGCSDTCESYLLCDEEKDKYMARLKSLAKKTPNRAEISEYWDKFDHSELAVNVPEQLVRWETNETNGEELIELKGEITKHKEWL